MWCVIPVAGRATRLASVAAGRPKALAEVAGRPLLAHLLDRLAPPITDVCLVVSGLGDDVRSRFGDETGGLRLHYARQEEPRGVADAVACAGPLVTGPFIALMGDAYFDRPLGPCIERWRGTGAPGGVLVERAAPDPSGGMGLVRVEGDRVVEIWKGPYERGAEWRVCGLMMLPEGFFAAARQVETGAAGELELEDVVAALLREGMDFRAVPYGGWRRNVNTPADLEAVLLHLRGQNSRR